MKKPPGCWTLFDEVDAQVSSKVQELDRRRQKRPKMSLKVHCLDRQRHFGRRKASVGGKGVGRSKPWEKRGGKEEWKGEEMGWEEKRGGKE